MDFDGNMCYFCGTYWKETGNIIYTFDGQIIAETVDKGFVGRFDASNIINGIGKFETMIIDETKELSHIQAHSGSISCIGKTYTGGYSCFAEIHELPSNPSYYSYRVARPSNSYEVLMDLAKTSNKVVTVSRFTSPETDMKYYFGLRYGSPTVFTALIPASTFMTTGFGNTPLLFSLNRTPKFIFVTLEKAMKLWCPSFCLTLALGGLRLFYIR
ncbi:MAG: hypothetical protein K6E93_03825 [Bacteroidales bacterium]|nr:hypothetical protein [Bacteroidales bacterium]